MPSGCLTQKRYIETNPGEVSCRYFDITGLFKPRERDIVRTTRKREAQNRDACVCHAQQELWHARVAACPWNPETQVRNCCDTIPTRESCLRTDLSEKSSDVHRAGESGAGQLTASDHVETSASITSRTITCTAFREHEVFH